MAAHRSRRSSRERWRSLLPVAALRCPQAAPLRAAAGRPMRRRSDLRRLSRRSWSEPSRGKMRRLSALIVRDIKVDFGGDAGRRDFVRTWELDRPATSRLWRELDEVLQLGCARDRRPADRIPSMFSRLSEFDDPFTAALAIRPGAALRRGPSDRAARGRDARLGSCPAREVDGDAGSVWQHVAARRTAATGYVRSRLSAARSTIAPVSRSATAAGVMIIFIAGD